MKVNVAVAVVLVVLRKKKTKLLCILRPLPGLG